MPRNARFFIHGINDVRLPSKMLCRAKSMKMNPMGYKTVKTDNTSQYVRPTKDIPGPKALPLLGNSFRFMPFIGEYYNVNVLTLMRMLRDKYGNIVKLDDPTQEQPRIFLFSPELCKEMYKLQGKWPTRNSLEPLHYYRQSREHIYNGQYGLVTSQGESWQDFRSKVTLPMMRPDIVKTYAGQINEITSDFVEKLPALRDPKILELPSDFMNELYKWSLETMCSIALNCRMGCLKPNLAVDSEPQQMINCVQEAFDLIYRLENLPSLWKVYNTRNLKKLFHALDTINAISEKHVEFAKTKFLETADNTNLKDRSILEKLLSIDKQTAHVMALDILMSTDTTSNAAGALLYYMANNAEKQEKLREEAISVLPDKTTHITEDILKNVSYVKACIKESMRLFPIVSGVLRTMQRQVSIGGYTIPEGSNVMACHALLSMDSIYFPEPEKYIPERWMRGNLEYLSYKTLHPYVYMPFGYGVRSCVGQRVAEMELMIFILKVVRNFRIEWHYGPLEYKSQIVNSVTSPLRFKLIDL
ncbi:cytochrome P450 CYP12A2-like [Temnothorax curvispinosus]|uniref:Cytochrome P450 CYP12A2-like n=1 Tax=Temnothorax curvispinosus TaxID=300111 RepID=A0A6J1PYD5_9HYME|nr:cytochrome P450 CYP12A2-like [Temnothorax curvispinosus]